MAKPPWKFKFTIAHMLFFFFLPPPPPFLETSIFVNVHDSGVLLSKLAS